MSSVSMTQKNKKRWRWVGPVILGHLLIGVAVVWWGRDQGIPKDFGSRAMSVVTWPLMLPLLIGSPD